MKTRCMSCGGPTKKMAVGGTTTKRIIKKSTGGMYGIPQENLGTSGQYGFAKKGGATKSAKFAALAPPYNKATFADKIVGAKKSAGSKKLPKAQLGAIIKAFSKVVKPVAKAVKKAKPKTVDFRTAQTKDLVKNAFQNIERNSMKQKLQEIEKIRKLKYPNGDPVYKSIFNVKKP